MCPHALFSQAQSHMYVSLYYAAAVCFHQVALSSTSFISGALICIIINVLFHIKYSNLLSFDSLKY